MLRAQSLSPTSMDVWLLSSWKLWIISPKIALKITKRLQIVLKHWTAWIPEPLGCWIKLKTQWQEPNMCKVVAWVEFLTALDTPDLIDENTHIKDCINLRYKLSTNLKTFQSILPMSNMWNHRVPNFPKDTTPERKSGQKRPLSNAEHGPELHKW